MINNMASQIANTIARSSLQTIQSNDSDFQSDSTSDTLETPSISKASNPRKRKHQKRRHEAWTYARKPIQGVESIYDISGSKPRRIWYCKEQGCDQYSCLSTRAASHHLIKKHGITLDQRPSQVSKAIQSDLRNVFNQQTLLNNDNILRGAIDRTAIHQALLPLIVHHDLPLSTVEWPELHTLIHAINSMAVGCIWTTHQTTANHIARTFTERREQVKQLLQQSQSLIHLTTDTWHSPNFKELQAITAHFVDASNTRQKALLSLPELQWPRMR